MMEGEVNRFQQYFLIALLLMAFLTPVLYFLLFLKHIYVNKNKYKYTTLERTIEASLTSLTRINFINEKFAELWTY